MTEASGCRFSIVKCDSDSDTDSSDEHSSNPFGYIRYYNPQNETETETRYSSFIDYGEPIHSEARMVQDDERQYQNREASVTVTSTAKVKLTHQISESSEASSHVAPRTHLACEDLLNIDENLPVGQLMTTTRKVYVPTTRQSLPSKFVGNKFSESSLTTIEIPEWQSTSSDNQLNLAVHSSSIDVELNNTLTLPDRVVAELLYNLDAKSMDSDETVIKPPTVFENDTQQKAVSISLENIGFHKHSINSDKPKRRSSTDAVDRDDVRRCTSTHFIHMDGGRRGCVDFGYSSPRSSDSGMADSCTLNSPDFGVDHHRLSKMLSLSEMEARDFNSQCPCISPFGSTPRTSCDTPIMMTGTRQDSASVSLASFELSLATSPITKVHSKLINVNPNQETPRCCLEVAPHKSKSLGCLSDTVVAAESERVSDEKAEIFKSGLYAHWWLKAKIPARVVKGIYEETRSSNNTGKGFLLCV